MKDLINAVINNIENSGVNELYAEEEINAYFYGVVDSLYDSDKQNLWRQEIRDIGEEDIELVQSAINEKLGV